MSTASRDTLVELEPLIRASGSTTVKAPILGAQSVLLDGGAGDPYRRCARPYGARSDLCATYPRSVPRQPSALAARHQRHAQGSHRGAEGLPADGESGLNPSRPVATSLDERRMSALDDVVDRRDHRLAWIGSELGQDRNQRRPERVERLLRLPNVEHLDQASAMSGSLRGA
jgi:hypothetical protein